MGALEARRRLDPQQVASRLDGSQVAAAEGDSAQVRRVALAEEPVDRVTDGSRATDGGAHRPGHRGEVLPKRRLCRSRSSRDRRDRDRQRAYRHAGQGDELFHGPRPPTSWILARSGRFLDPSAMRDTLVMGARRLGSSRALWIVVDALLVATLAAVFLFPIAARVSASDAGAQVPTETDRLRLPPVQRTPAPPLLDVPVFSPKGPVAATVARGQVLRDAGTMRVAVDAGLVALVGQTGATVSRIVRDDRVQLIPYASKKPFTYPFRYPRLDPMLDRVLGRSLGVERSARAND